MLAKDIRRRARLRTVSRSATLIMRGCGKVGKEADVSDHSDAKLRNKTELILLPQIN